MSVALTVVGMIGLFAAAPGASASELAADPVRPSVEVTAEAPTKHASEVPVSGLPGETGANASGDNIFKGEKSFVQYYAWECLDDSNANGLRLHTCSQASFDARYQKFYWTSTGDYFKFQNAYTGLCLDGSANYGVRTHGCSDASYNNGYQKWRMYASDPTENWVSWKNVATGECMDYSLNYGLRLHTCSTASFSNGYQTWSRY
ncbi:RICIN domain-containing protein [Streptomyces sp. NPDC057682]|uniref:RICIN domain-containing protein n=1 Tax=Streptomyces sp. NPDC057682 TaxID=3346210 RepID=UPI0036C95E57